MEAVMIAGAAALVVGGFYSIGDFLNEAGFGKKKSELKGSSIYYCTEISIQRGVKKMSRLHI